MTPSRLSAHRARLGLRKELGLRDEFVLLYAGTLGMAHGLETLLQAARRLRGHNEIVFLVVGAGAERDELCRLLEGMRLPNVRVLRSRTGNEFPPFWPPRTFA